MLQARSALAAIAVTLLCTSACSSASSTAAPATGPTPELTLLTLSGVDTEITLAAAFLDQLSALRIHLGLVGDATRSANTLAFPVTGGDATYYAPGSRTPFFESDIQHLGSGIELRRGKVTVELTNFDLNGGGAAVSGEVASNGQTLSTATSVFSVGESATSLQLHGDDEIDGLTLSLTADADRLLDSAFGLTTVGGLVGSVVLTLA